MGDKGTDTTTMTTGPAPAAMDAYNRLLERAARVAEQPYAPYGGELTAPVNAQQNLGVSNINQYAGWGMPYFGQAAGFAQELGQGPSAEDLAKYQNPYTQQVVDATMRTFDLQNRQQQQGVLGNAAAQGALGGDRVGVAQAQLAGQQTAAQAPVIAGLYSRGYDQALNAWQQGRGQAAGALGSIGTAGTQAGLAGAGAQFGAGSALQANEQARLDALYRQFQQAQGFPYQQTQWLAGLQTGVGSQMGGTSQTTAPAPNPWAQVAGPALMAAGMFLRRGGRVAGFADGGDVGAVPYGGVGFIPGVGIVRGRGAPEPPRSPAQAQQGSPVRDALAFANSLQKNRSGVGAPMDIRYDAGITPGLGEIMPSVSSAWGGFGGSPLYRRGGAVRGFADGGAPDDLEFAPDTMQDVLLPRPVRTVSYGMGDISPSFEERWAPAREAVGVGDFDPQGMNNTSAYAPIEPGVASPSGFPGAEPGFAVPLPQARPDGILTQAGVGPGEGWIPAPREGLQVTPGLERDFYVQPNVAAAPATSTSEPERKGFGLGLLPSELRLPLMTAGLAMMASRSPHLGVAIGEGGLAGVGAYSQQQKQREEKAFKEKQLGLTEARLDNETRRLDQAAKQAMERLALETRRTVATESRLDAENWKPTGTFTKEGYPVLYNSKTGTTKNAITGEPIAPGTEIVSAKIAGTPIPEAARGLHGEEFLKHLPPGEDLLVKGIAEYAVDPKTLSSRGGHREDMLKKTLQYDPNFDQKRYNETYNAVNRFSTGKQGDTVRSFNVGIAHLVTLEQLVGALNNRDINAFNRIANFVQTELGYPAPTNFEAARDVVANEILKAIIGSGTMALQDREEAQKRISSARSPDQLMGVMSTYKELMAGQIRGLKKQYEDATGLKNFDRKLMPETLRQMKLREETRGETTVGPQSSDSQNARALKWANENPNDPRAAAIKKRLGVP